MLARNSQYVKMEPPNSGSPQVTLIPSRMETSGVTVFALSIIKKFHTPSANWHTFGRSLRNREGVRKEKEASNSNFRNSEPDLAFVSRRKIIFVHGCFWHKHNCRHGSVSPATNSDYWNRKRERNAKRDCQNIIALRRDGWKVLVLWECWTRDTGSLRKRIARFLRGADSSGNPSNCPASR